ncbi:unnamed protein product, partial [Heligmosomoides polygyrus]|uniref:Saposin B-type domain-containing protein n=1 Tax=Heligmosomoides polygyrus TaxID=6339 RepID=A0A183FC23_HELPZ
MKWLAVICVLAILGSGLAIGPNCKEKDPKVFEGLSQAEIELICGKDNDWERKVNFKAVKEALEEKCKKGPKFFGSLSAPEIALLCPDAVDDNGVVKFAPHNEG